MIRRELSKEQIANKPWEIWNAFVDLLAMEDYDDLTGIQQSASSLFWYNHEVQNGGHLQYLVNHGMPRAQTTLIELKSLGAKKHAELLEKALQKCSSLSLLDVEEIDDSIELALEDHFQPLDDAFYVIEPSIQAILENILAKNREVFVSIK